MFFILKEKILKQASYVNVKVMRKNSKRATVLQSLLVVIILLLSQQPKKSSLNRLTDCTHIVPEATGHELRRPSLRPMNAEPETLFHPGVDCGASPLQVGQLQSHDTCKVKVKMLKGLRLTPGMI